MKRSKTPDLQYCFSDLISRCWFKVITKTSRNLIRELSCQIQFGPQRKNKESRPALELGLPAALCLSCSRGRIQPLPLTLASRRHGWKRSRGCPPTRQPHRCASSLESLLWHPGWSKGWLEPCCPKSATERKERGLLAQQCAPGYITNSFSGTQAKSPLGFLEWWSTDPVTVSVNKARICSHR